ncbi:transcriptional regulator, MucR family [Methylobacterium sp. 4-46]|uniref:MucR family transcriptional regulator n=1 Tax=unclassified Methylobacterium TaxID=2615210 RepID=UPI000152E608|nr:MULTISPECIES: MucR family transcriptional regulator [Methylobacterium]ACA19871.1 transcriptional regulator, MucR family [Methylobacterium sp. 4-46]WFT79054.1 MucR family transcriptional regulator [Methylobacterium nodulans]
MQAGQDNNTNVNDGNAVSSDAVSIKLVADIVAAYVSNNMVRPDDLPSLIAAVGATLGDLGKSAAPPAEEKPKATPTQIRKSITPDALISFIDAKPYKSMKRHLTKNGLTPDEYRQMYGLPRDYPMVAPNYAAQRSELAKSMGLGALRRGGAKGKPK